MIKSIVQVIFIIFIASGVFWGCSKFRESAGVTRKVPDEFKVIENPPLVIPPDFDLIPPSQIQNKNIDDIEKELAQEILFGLGQDNISEKNQLSTMNKILLEAKAKNVSNDIRDEINSSFVNEMETDSAFQIEWETEQEILDAVKESERIRKQIFSDESISQGDVPIKKEKVKKKKKKRFIFF